MLRAYEEHRSFQSWNLEKVTSYFAIACAEAGVLGVMPGVIGLLQAIEAIKLIVELGSPLIGKIL